MLSPPIWVVVVRVGVFVGIALTSLLVEVVSLFVLSEWVPYLTLTRCMSLPIAESTCLHWSIHLLIYQIQLLLDRCHLRCQRRVLIHFIYSSLFPRAISIPCVMVARKRLNQLFCFFERLVIQRSSARCVNRL